MTSKVGDTGTKKRSRLLRRLLWFVVAAAVVGSLLAGAPEFYYGVFPGDRATAQAEPLPELRAKALVVLDVDTGELLVSVNGHERLPPGPLAQLAVILVAWNERYAEQPSVGEQVLVGGRAAERSGFSMGLRYGELVHLLHVIEGLWFWGAADAAVAIVEHVWGSEAAFARQIGFQLPSFGARETHLISPEGLDRPGQYTTAYDMARIAQAILRDPTLGPLAARRRVTVELADGRETLTHMNSFLLRYPGATGVKSGYDEASGYVAAASSRRNGHHLVAVVLGAESPEERYADLSAVLDYSFRNIHALRASPAVDAVPYDIEPGDTLSAIAARFATDPRVLQEFNGLRDPSSLEAGGRLWIPRSVEGQ